MKKQPTIFIGYTPEIANESQSKVCNLLKMNYDILFEVYPNPSGFSKEVSGQVRFSSFRKKIIHNTVQSFNCERKEHKSTLFKV